MKSKNMNLRLKSLDLSNSNLLKLKMNKEENFYIEDNFYNYDKINFNSTDSRSSNEMEVTNTILPEINYIKEKHFRNLKNENNLINDLRKKKVVYSKINFNSVDLTNQEQMINSDTERYYAMNLINQMHKTNGIKKLSSNNLFSTNIPLHNNKRNEVQINLNENENNCKNTLSNNLNNNFNQNNQTANEIKKRIKINEYPLVFSPRTSLFHLEPTNILTSGREKLLKNNTNNLNKNRSKSNLIYDINLNQSKLNKKISKKLIPRVLYKSSKNIYKLQEPNYNYENNKMKQKLNPFKITNYVYTNGTPLNYKINSVTINTIPIKLSKIQKIF